MKSLFIIPARGGSKGIPKKNIKNLGGKPLLIHSLDIARQFTSDEHICISTDDDEILNVIKEFHYQPIFKRPSHLASDKAGSYEVLIHALDVYEQLNGNYDQIVLLQPTSPFRKAQHVQESLNLFTDQIDMVVSVKETKSNPYYLLYEEDEKGFLKKSKSASFLTRQECPGVYEMNGAVYVINTSSLKKQPMSSFIKVKKYVMDDLASCDLDTPIDWMFCEFLLEKGLISL